MPDRPHTDAELDAAITAIADSQRLREAQDVVMRAAPALQRVLAAALVDGGWFDTGHDHAVRDAVAGDDPRERARAVRTLMAEETRLGMLVGVAIGFELSRELDHAPTSTPPGTPTTPGASMPPGGATPRPSTKQED